MMAYTADKPAGSDVIADSDQIIKNNFSHIVSAFDTEHVWDANTAANCKHDATLFQSFVGVGSHNVASTGAEAITGVGFQPQIVFLIALKSSAGSAYFPQMSFGGAIASDAGNCVIADGADGSIQDGSGSAVYLLSGATASYATLTAVGADGFTLTWAKVGSPTGTAYFMYVCLRFAS
jgi:hypothetical protein